jgi:hypothetical protein
MQEAKESQGNEIFNTSSVTPPFPRRKNNTIRRKIRAGAGMYILPALYPSKPMLAL